MTGMLAAFFTHRQTWEPQAADGAADGLGTGRTWEPHAMAPQALRRSKKESALEEGVRRSWHWKKE